MAKKSTEKEASTSVSQKPDKGNITRQFTVWCGICGDWEMESASGLDQFIASIEKNWRLSREHGWVHKKCCKMMPVALKL
jgi:hypothetical protein